MGTQMNEFKKAVSEERKLWKILKGTLYLVSLSFMVIVGYQKSGEHNPSILIDPVEQNITQEQPQRDSLYIAYNEIVSEYSSSTN